MTKIESGDRCRDCKHCKIWSTDYNKASCRLHDEEDFRPDRNAPGKCVGQVSRS